VPDRSSDVEVIVAFKAAPAISFGQLNASTAVNAWEAVSAAIVTLSTVTRKPCASMITGPSPRALQWEVCHVEGTSQVRSRRELLDLIAWPDCRVHCAQLL